MRSLGQALVCLPLIFVHSLPVIVALVALLGAGQAVSGPTWTALLPRIVGEDHVGAAMSLAQVSFTMAQVAGPAVGGLLSGWLGNGSPLTVDAVTYGLLSLVAALMRTRRIPVPRATDQPARGGFGLLRRDPLVAPLLVGLALFVLLGMTANVVEIFLIRHTLRASAAWYGGVGATWAAASVLGALLAARLTDNRQRVRATVVGTTVMTIALLGFAAAPSVGWLIPAAILGGTGNGLINVCVGTVVMTRSLDRDRGRVSAALNAAMNTAAVSSLVLGAVLASFISPRGVFAIGAGLGLLTVLLTAPRVLRAARSGAGHQAGSDPGESGKRQ